MRRRPFVGALGAVVAVLVAGCGEEQQATEFVRPVKAMKVLDAEAFAKRFFPGRAEATQEVNIAFEVPGQLAERPVNVGDQVEQGQLLARLDPRDYQNELDRATAERDRAKSYFDRIAKAVKTGAVARQELTDARARYDMAVATVGIAEKALEDTNILAPFEGTVAATYVENFQNVQAKQAILRLLETSQIEFWVNIPERLISYAPYVRDIRVEFDAFPGKPVPARIKEVSNEASEVTRTYPVNLVMEQPEDFTVLPGMAGKATGRIELPDARKTSAYEVPIGALFNPEAEKNYVWVVDEATMTVSPREVEPVEHTARGIALRGIEPGEWIVTAGVSYLREGQKVRFLE